MERYLKITIILVVISKTQATVDGKTFMDPLDTRKLDQKLPGEDPCNPLYWYPRHVPEYCYYKPTIKPDTKPPLPVPIPVPVPVPPPPPIPIPLPVPPPMPIPIPFPPPMPLPFPPPPIPIPIPGPVPIPHLNPVPFPYPAYPIPPYGIHNPLISVSSPFYPPMYSNAPYGYPPQAGMVPGLPGMVSRDGGINILPFSDVYSDILEKHKNKMIRKKLATILHECEDFPNRKTYRRLKNLRKML